MTAEALEGIKSEIQKFMMQVSSRVAGLRGQNDKQNQGESDGAKDMGGPVAGKMTALVFCGMTTTGQTEL